MHLQQYIQDDEPFALLFIDLDKFKTVNDTQGHHIGDELLTLLANRLKSAIAEYDEIYRFGGDEFIIILRNSDNKQQLKERAQRILNIAKTPMMLNSQSYQTTISIGISLFKEHSTETNTLIRFADLAMYKAKELGKNQFVIFNQSFDEQAGEQFEISKLLFEALAENQFELYYQPQISLQDKKITGIEAIVRWNHPIKGFISPTKFIPIAESNGFIVQLGQTILMEPVKCEKRYLMKD